MVQCPYCDREYTQNKSVYRHIRNEHDSNYKPNKPLYICDECKNSYSNKIELISHIKEQHAHNKTSVRRQKIICSICHTTFPRYEEYEKHLGAAHGVVMKSKELQFQNDRGLFTTKMFTSIVLFLFFIFIKIISCFVFYRFYGLEREYSNNFRSSLC